MKLRFAVVLIALLLAVLSISLLRWGVIDSKGNSGLALERPSFVALAATDGQEGVNFLQQEAGISAYVKVDQAIDLEQVRGAFKTVETVSDEYIIGEVALPDLPEEAHPHVYVNKDGWIVAYYSKDEPASKIMQWIGYGGGPITRTTLDDAIRKIYDSLQLPYPENVRYYSFEYPNANRVILTAEIIEKGEKEDFFYLKIPKGCQLFEASWSHYAPYGDEWSHLSIDDTTINEPGWGVGIWYGDLTTRLKVDFRHKIKIKGQAGEGVAIVLIYRV